MLLLLPTFRNAILQLILQLWWRTFSSCIMYRAMHIPQTNSMTPPLAIVHNMSQYQGYSLYPRPKFALYFFFSVSLFFYWHSVCWVRQIIAARIIIDETRSGNPDSWQTFPLCLLPNNLPSTGNGSICVWLFRDVITKRERLRRETGREREKKN